MQTASIPNLTANERGFQLAFQLASGELIAVLATPVPAQDGTFAVEVVARQCEADRTTTIVNGHPVTTPPQRHTIAQDALATGAVTLPAWLAQLSVEAAARVVPLRAALTAWTTIFGAAAGAALP